MWQDLSTMVTGQQHADSRGRTRIWLSLSTPDGGARPLRKLQRQNERTLSRELLAHCAAPPPPRRSLSHSGGHAAIAIAPVGSRAGVDIETMKQRNVLGLAEFAFSSGELEQLRLLDPSAALERFYLLWTLKEAFAKALGIPLIPALRECQFLHLAEGWLGRVPTTESWCAMVCRPTSSLTLAAVVVGRRTEIGEEWDCEEWPSHTGAGWPRLASLSGGPGTS